MYLDLCGTPHGLKMEENLSLKILVEGKFGKMTYLLEKLEKIALSLMVLLFIITYLIFKA